MATGGFENENAPEMIGSDTRKLSTSQQIRDISRNASSFKRKDLH